MRILVINPILYTSNGRHLPQVSSIKDTMIHGMCMGFVRLGHEVTLAAVDDYRPTADEDYDFDVLWLRDTFRRLLPSPLPLPVALVSYLWRESRRFDMVLCSECFAFTSLFAALMCPHKTIIWQELSLHQRKWHQIPSQLWHRLVLPLAFRRVRAVVPRSSRARDFIARYLPQVSAESVDHGIDLSWLPVSELKRPQFIAVGRLYEPKGMSDIITRFARFAARPGYGDVTLLIAGRGPQEPELRAMVSRLDLEDKVRFLGFLTHDELGRHLSQSLASLVATRHDLNMVSVTESIACGTPVVMNTVPCTAEFVRDNGLGIVCDDWGADELAQVAGDPTFAARCRHMRDRLSCESAAQRLVTIFGVSSRGGS